MSDDLTRIATLLGDLEEDELLETVEQSLSAGVDPLAGSASSCSLLDGVEHVP